MRRLLLALPLVLVLLGLGLGANSLERVDKEVILTIYGGDLALVSEFRTIELEPGRTVVRLKGFPGELLPNSVFVEGLTGPIEVLEQEFLHEPVNTPTLLERFLGQEIEVRDGESVYRGILLGFDGLEGVILRERTGEVQIIKSPTGFTLPELPLLADEPTLTWLIETELGGEQPIRLSYLTHGLSWKASYTAHLAEGEDGMMVMALKSLVSISNDSGLTYRDARVRLVAGQPHRVARERGYPRVALEVVAAAPPFLEEAVVEYHLYTLDRPATLEDGRTKQLAFISAPRVQIERHYIYEPQVLDGIWTKVEFLNSELNGLGRPLPAGTVRFYQEGLFLGEDLLRHTPVDERVSLMVGRAFDLVGERTLVEHRQVAERRYRDTLLITLRNHKDKDVTIRVIEHLRGEWTILRESQEYKKLDAERIEFVVEVEAGGEAQITYTVEYQL